MRVLYVSTEVFPALKTGGLADVNAALPKALRELGEDVRLLLPAFPEFLQTATDVKELARLDSPFCPAPVRILQCQLNGVPAWLIEAGDFYARGGNPYVDHRGHDWPDNAQRFALLGWVAARFADGSLENWRPDIVHAHDWHAGLAPAYLAARGGERPASVFTVHNLGYQGEFPAETFRHLALPDHFFSLHGLEFYGKVNFMKAGLHYSDRITTVSPGYAREIQTAEFGFGMDGLLRSRAGAIRGILNGVDRAYWNPATDPCLDAPYRQEDMAGKLVCQAGLRRDLGLAASSGPLFGVVSRLTAQKGIDLLEQSIGHLLERGGQLVLLGSGDKDLEARLPEIARAHPKHLHVRIGYDETLAHRIMAGCDAILVPSRFEPCGLTQLYALAYGTLPLVHRVGGLADTVCDATPANLADGLATGFVFDQPDVPSLKAALDRLFLLWQSPGTWSGMRQNAMRQDFGWPASARQYHALYRELRPGA